MHTHSVDIESTFLNADIQEDIYMRQLIEVEDGTRPVIRMLKSISMG
jgi:hypothetical protein